MEKTIHSENERVILWTSGILTLLLTMALSYIDHPLKTMAAPHGIVSFELAGSLDSAMAILNSWDARAKIFAGLSLGIDFLYLVSYSIFLFLLILGQARKLQQRFPLLYRFGIVLMSMQILAAIFDAVENYGLIRLLTGTHDQIFASLAFFCSTLKFTFIIMGIFYYILVFFFRRLIK